MDGIKEIKPGGDVYDSLEQRQKRIIFVLKLLDCGLKEQEFEDVLDMHDELVRSAFSLNKEI